MKALEKWFNKWNRKVVTGRCLIELKNMFKELIDEIDNAQEDFGNLDWISKEQAIKIIKKYS